MNPNRDIEFGVILSPFGPHVSPSFFKRLATTAEKKGFDIVWTGDHVAFPEKIPETYPFTSSGEAPPAQGIEKDTYDSFNVLSYLANATDSIRLGTNVCIVPYRNPVLLAKQALSVEALSEGRFDFGVAPGWLETEFDVLNVPFEERGSRTDEFLEIFERACEEHEFSYDGPHHSFPTTGFYPAPEADRPPVWVGGFSGASFRRVAEFGDGWTIYGTRPDKVEEGRDRLQPAWNDYDREGRPRIAAGRSTHVGTDTDLDTDRPLIGSPSKIQDDIEEYIEAGTTHLFIDFFTLDPEEQIEHVERFGDKVIDTF